MSINLYIFGDNEPPAINPTFQDKEGIRAKTDLLFRKLNVRVISISMFRRYALPGPSVSALLPAFHHSPILIVGCG